MTKNSAPSGKPRGTSGLRSIKSRLDRQASSCRSRNADAQTRLDLLESWILDLMLYLDIEVSELIEAIGEEEST